ncbi:MAG: hypothetical protein V7754_08080 [Halioglobus sp.]
MSAIATAYFERYAISHIDLKMESGVVDSADLVCTLTLGFTPGYQVQFNLLGKQAQLGEVLTKISPGGQLTSTDGTSSSDLEEDLIAFFHHIESRLDRIEHEERVQSITFLGNTFVLNNKTVFDVVGDKDGRLSIEMHKANERKSAKLLASSLLDGLYDGSIVLKP